MVSKEKLEDILHNEEIEERWNSIDHKKLNKAEKDRKEYLNYTKKEYHPMSYQVKKEVETWNEPLFEWYENMEGIMIKLAFAYVTFWFLVGLIVVKAILL